MLIYVINKQTCYTSIWYGISFSQFERDNNDYSTQYIAYVIYTEELGVSLKSPLSKVNTKTQKLRH